jgi:hypothetical protein
VTPYLAFRLGRLLLLLVLAGLVPALGSDRSLSRRVRLLLAAVVAAAVLSYPNFGVFHVRWGHIHYWDAYHYFVGAKYLPELGYTRLYDATLVAGRELGGFGTVVHVRDLTTYSYRRADALDAAEIRARFSPTRWEAFKRDVAFFSPYLQPWTGPLLDHGYNDPPPRALLLHGLVRWVPASAVSLTVLTSVDYALVLGAFWAVWRAFGAVPAALALAFFALSFFARFDFIGGSVLRWDWIAAVLVGVAALARGAGATAGLCLGYAVLARLFPLLFLVPLAAKWLQRRRERVPEPALTRCLVVAGGLLVLVGIGVATGSDLTTEYVERMRLHNAVPSLNRVGLGSLLAVHGAPWGLTPDGRSYVLQDALVAARPAGWVLTLAALTYLLAAVPLVLRARTVESLLYGVPLVFFALSPSSYYYSFLVLLVLLPWHAGRPDSVRVLGIALLALNMAISYAFELAADGWLALYYQVSIQMGVFFLLWLALEYVRLRRHADQPAPLPASLGSTPAST